MTFLQSRRILISLLLLSAILISCGKGLNEIREDEKKLSISPAEQVALGKSLLEIGKPSDAKELFSSALNSKALSVDECTESGEGGFRTCLYCDALYGKAIADLIGTLQLISGILESLAISEEQSQTPRLSGMQETPRKNTEEIDKLISGTIDTLIGILMPKIDSLRENLKEVIDRKCETQVNATAKLNILGSEIFIPGKPKEDEKIIYSPYFANFVNSILSLLSGILDIAYSQNWEISAVYIREFMKELLSQSDQRNLFKIVQGIGDLFAKNPRLWTQREDRKYLWSKSTTDLAESFEGLSEFLKNLPDICKNPKEATQMLISEPQLGDLSVPLCNFAGSLKSEFSPVFEKWARSLAGNLSCSKEGKSVVIPAPANDGCIRIFEDLTAGGAIGGVLKSLGFVEIFAFSHSEFFRPRDLRAFLPLVRKEGEKYAFHFEVEAKGNDSEHFAGVELYSLAGGFPTKITEKIEIPKDGISGSPLYIPFQDPTFGGSLLVTLYYLNSGKCSEYESKNGLCEAARYIIPEDLDSGNYALNKFIAKLLTSSIGGLIKNILQ